MQALLDTFYLPVSDIRDNHERAWVKHRYPHRDGAEHDDLGREPYQGTLQVGFLGDFWRTTYDLAVALHDSGRAFNFTHPRTKAVYRVVMRSFRPVHSARIQNGCLATIDLEETTDTSVGLVVTAAGAAGAAASFDDAASAASSALGALS